MLKIVILGHAMRYVGQERMGGHVGNLTLEMAPEAIRELGYRIVDMIADNLADPTRRPVFPPAQTQDAMESVFGGPFPRDGTPPRNS